MFHAHNYYPEFLVRNGEKEPLRNKLYPSWKERSTGFKEGLGVAEVAVDYAPGLIAREMLEFIRASSDKPFLCYYALNIPHANNEGGVEERIGRDGMRVPDHGPFKDKPWPSQEKGFARMMQYIDQDMGSIFALLEELGIDEHTIVMFSSDNGPHQEGGHEMEYFDSNGPLRGMKRDLYEGGVRVPFIARWPGKIPAGKTSDHVSGFQDVFPTALELAGAKKTGTTDGLSMVPTLLGRPEEQDKHPYLYWEFYERGGRIAVVDGDWKAVRYDVQENPDAPIQLYDLPTDLGETNDVASAHPERVQHMSKMMKDAHEDTGAPR